MDRADKPVKCPVPSCGEMLLAYVSVRELQGFMDKAVDVAVESANRIYREMHKDDGE